VHIASSTLKVRRCYYRVGVTGCLFFLSYVLLPLCAPFLVVCTLCWLHSFSFLPFFFSFLGWGKAETTWYVGHKLAFCTRPGCGAVSGMRICRENRSTRMKPASVQLCPSQNPQDFTCAPNLATALGSRPLTAWAMTRLFFRGLFNKNLII
jgi:hypothetical protein